MTEPSFESTHERSLLPRLTSLRWYAALLVFLFHAAPVTGWSPLRAFSFGQTGVSFFFVLSGFVLTWSFRPGPGANKRFWTRRFARVYPSHVVTWTARVIAGLVIAGGAGSRGLGIVAGFFLLQAWSSSSSVIFAGNGPAWSLSCEAFFYAVFPAIHSRMHRATTTALVSFTAVLMALTAGATVLLAKAGYGLTIAYPNPVMRLPEFVLGITLALVVRRGWRSPVPIWLPIALTVVCAAVARQAPDFPLSDFVMLPAVVLLIVTAATYDLRGRSGWLASRAAVWLGEVSFAFYLVHPNVLVLLDRSGHGRGPAGLVIGLGVSVALAAGLHYVVELPAQRWLIARYARAATP